MDINESIACTLDPWFWNQNSVQHGDNIAHNDESWKD